MFSFGNLIEIGLFKVYILFLFERNLYTQFQLLITCLFYIYIYTICEKRERERERGREGGRKGGSTIA